MLICRGQVERVKDRIIQLKNKKMKIDKINQTKTLSQVFSLFFLFFIILIGLIFYCLRYYTDYIKEIQKEDVVILMINEDEDSVVLMINEDEDSDKSEEEIREEIRFLEERKKEIEEILGEESLYENEKDDGEEKSEIVEKEKATTCFLLLNPVVGKDGKVYDNRCLAEEVAKVEVDEEETNKRFRSNY